MSLSQIFNGVQSTLQDRDKKIFAVISRELEVDEEEMDRIVTVVYDELEKGKTGPIKPQKRQPKNTKTATVEKKKKISGYRQFQKDMWGEITHALKTDSKARTFTGKGGAEVEIDVSEFNNGAPKLEHITKKCASLWSELDTNEKAEWLERAKKAAEKEAKGVKENDVEESSAKEDTTKEETVSASADKKKKAPPKTKVTKKPTVNEEDNTSASSADSKKGSNKKKAPNDATKKGEGRNVIAQGKKGAVSKK